MTTCVICQNRDADPDYGQCCPLCPSRLARRLAEIPGLCEELHGLGYVQRDHRGDHGFPAVDQKGNRLPHFDQVSNVLPSGPINGARSGPRVGGTGERPVPIRIDPTDLLAAPRPASLAVHVRSPWPADQIGYLPIATELDFWASDWAEQRGEARPYYPLVPDLVRWLLDRLDWAMFDHQALDEFNEKIHGIHGALMGALGLFPAPPKSMEAPCRNPDCEGDGSLTLWQEYPGARVQCSMCTALLSEGEYADYVADMVNSEKQRRVMAAKDVVLVDVDGTLTLRTFGAEGRRGPYDWDRVGEDDPNEPVIELVNDLRRCGYLVTFLSGRDEVCRDATWRWLIDHGAAQVGDELLMRPRKDNRPDEEIKAEIYERQIAPYHSVKYVIDDRDKVVAMWRSLGLTVLQVAGGDF